MNTNSHEYQKVLTHVLQPRPCVQPRFVKPAEIEPGSAVEAVIEKAAQRAKAVYAKGTFRVSNSQDYPERFADACAETALALQEAVEVAADDLEAALIESIVVKAGWTREPMRPATLRAQAEMQIALIEAARHAKRLYMRQQSLI